MAGLSSVLANIPGLAGWEAARQSREESQGNQLRQASGVMGLQQALQAQAMKQQEAAREQQFRAAIAQARTPEEQLAVASKFMGPDALGKMIQGSQDRQAQTAATKEATMARLQQAAQQFDANWQLRMRSATTAEEKLALEQQREAFKQSLQREAARLSGARANYDFGFMPSTPPAQTVQAPSPQAPTGQTVQGQFGDVSVNLQNASPAMIAAARGQPEAQGNPGLMAALGGAPAAPMPAQAPRPVVPPVQPQALPPAAPNNLDARDLRLQGQPTAQPAAPAASSPQPQMPNFVGPPREVNRMKNEWLADQAKARSVAEGKLNIAGGRESVFINRVVNSGNQAAADLENVVKLPMTTSRGIFGGRSQGKSLFEAGKETLSNTMTTQEVQMYNVFATGFQRALAAIEGAGLAPSNALMHQMDAVIFKEGDTQLTKMGKLAQTRQIVEKGLETVSVNSRVDPGTKKLVQDILEKVRKSVPFTGADIIRLNQLQASNPNATLNDVLNEKQSGGGAGGAWSQEKERRFQELQRKLRGG